MAQDEVLKLLKTYCSLLSLSGIPVDKAYLYGSYSRDTATDDSDIDIMIVSGIFDHPNDMMKAKAWRLTEEVDMKIEPYFVGLHKFLTDDVSPLLQVVKKDGIEITF